MFIKDLRENINICYLYRCGRWKNEEPVIRCFRLKSRASCKRVQVDFCRRFCRLACQGHQINNNSTFTLFTVAIESSLFVPSTKSVYILNFYIPLYSCCLNKEMIACRWKANSCRPII